MDKSPDLLNLPNTRAVSFEQQDGQYVIRGEADTGPEPCPKCDHFEFTRFGTRTQTFVDLPIHGMLVTVHLARQRFRCCRCGTVSKQPLPDMALDTDDGHGHAMTKRLAEWIGKAGLRLTFTEVSHQTGVHERTVRRIVAAHVRELEKSVVFETPDWLGLDEIHILGKVRLPARACNRTFSGRRRTHHA